VNQFHAGRVNQLRTHALLWSACFGQAVRRDLQFRSQTLLNVCSSLLELVLGVVPVLILTGQAGAASGWTGPLSVAVVGAYGVCAGLIDCFVAPNLRRIDTYVRRGDLDLVLIRPVNAPVYSALRWMEPGELSRVVAGLGLLLAGLHAAHVSPGVAAVGTAIGWAVIGIVGFSLLWANLVYLAFWVDSAEPVNEVALQVREAGKYPLGYFPRPVRAVLRSLIPAGLVAAVPVGVLRGPGPSLGIGACGLVGAIAVTALHWRAALHRYSSASS
jgi:ABC-2 type transport system permease protein